MYIYLSMQVFTHTGKTEETAQHRITRFPWRNQHESEPAYVGKLTQFMTTIVDQFRALSGSFLSPASETIARTSDRSHPETENIMQPDDRIVRFDRAVFFWPR